MKNKIEKLGVDYCLYISTVLREICLQYLQLPKDLYIYKSLHGTVWFDIVAAVSLLSSTQRSIGRKNYRIKGLLNTLFKNNTLVTLKPEFIINERDPTALELMDFHVDTISKLYKYSTNPAPASYMETYGDKEVLSTITAVYAIIETDDNTDSRRNFIMSTCERRLLTILEKANSSDLKLVTDLFVLTCLATGTNLEENKETIEKIRETYLGDKTDDDDVTHLRKIMFKTMREYDETQANQEY